jgi:uncharacterized protein (TIGR00645 family)
MRDDGRLNTGTLDPSCTKSHHHLRGSAMLTALAKAILAGRFLLVVFFLGLVWGLALFAVRFVGKLWELTTELWEKSEADLLIEMLHLLDSALVASLVLMVALSSYDSLVDRLQGEADQQQMRWVSRTDHGNLKIKVATAMVAISSIHLLQIFLRRTSRMKPRSSGGWSSIWFFWWALCCSAFSTASACITATPDGTKGSDTSWSTLT